MEIFNVLFESNEILKQKAMEVEKSNITALQKTNQEFKELFAQMSRPKKYKVIYVHETPSSY